MQTRTAQRFMTVAERFEGNASVPSHLSFEALAALAAPSTPDDVVEEGRNVPTFQTYWRRLVCQPHNRPHAPAERRLPFPAVGYRKTPVARW